MRFRGFLAGYLVGIFTIVGCASTNLFPWPYYAPDMPGSCYDQGELLGKPGKRGWPDQSLSVCKPDPDPTPGASVSPVKLKCIVTKIDDFYDIKAKYETCQNDLSACQHGPAPVPNP